MLIGGVKNEPLVCEQPYWISPPGTSLRSYTGRLSIPGVKHRLPIAFRIILIDR
jgi:hypothetical protein